MFFSSLFWPGHQCQSFPSGNKEWAILQIWQVITAANFSQDISFYGHNHCYSSYNENLHEHHVCCVRFLFALRHQSVCIYFELVSLSFGNVICAELEMFWSFVVGSKPLFMLARPPACLNLNASKQSVSTDFDIINVKWLLMHDLWTRSPICTFWSKQPMQFWNIH